ncbi:gamma-glutamylcyclotransferase [Candidatus Kaiserbacteria bacterium]|nr:gamma-glutamylcyclotransferase [Candidatus Kaiserbacteria bacterium]
MLTERLVRRCESASVVGVAEVSSCQLRFNKISKSDGSGKGSIESTDQQSDKVYGVVFRINSDELDDLDKFEGYGSGYDRDDKLPATLVGKGLPIEATTYVATDIDDKLYPYDWYLALVIAGAREHHLPIEYVAAVENVTHVPDPDENRRSRKEALDILKATDNWDLYLRLVKAANRGVGTGVGY